MDLVVETDRPARPGETFPGDRFYTAPGGKGANQAVAAARFAERSTVEPAVKMIGCVGDDVFGSELLNFMRDEAIDTQGMAVKPNTASGVAVIFTDAAGENYVNPVYGANALCSNTEVAHLKRLIESGGINTLLVQQEVPLETTHEAMLRARQHGVKVVLDPAPAYPTDTVPDGFYATADIVTPNESEAEALAEMQINTLDEAELAAQRIKSRFGCSNVVVTMGPNGACASIDDSATHLAPHDVAVVASVAAGDAFAGVVGQALTEGFDLPTALELGMAAGALCVTKPGAQESMPRRSEVIALARTRTRIPDLPI